MIIAVIPAKKGSNRLANKNLLEIFGESLLVRAIKYAKKIKGIKKIIVSTDSEDIATIAKDMKVDVIMRGQDLAGEAPLIDVYKHVLQNLGAGKEEVTHIIGIQPDHPDRKVDADEAIAYVIKNKVDDFFTVDTKGKKNGSLRILSLKALRQEQKLLCATTLDDCTNIHTTEDLLDAKLRLMRPNNKIEIGDKIISADGPAFVIAEAACNHMCDMNLAKEMIARASSSGADAIKFQTYSADKLTSKTSETYAGMTTKSQYEYYKQFDKFGRKEYEELFKYAEENKIIPFSTPFDIENAKMLNDIGMPLFKIASCDLPYADLLRTVASFGKPIILSTGGSELSEVKNAVVTLYEAGARDIILMACTLAYPTKPQDANYRKILSLKEAFPQFIIGMSDHVEPDENMICGVVYVSLGAKVIEKHYTLDRKIKTGGNFFSMEPADLKKLVQNIRLTEMLFGESTFKSYEAENPARKNARRSLVANVAIKAGTVITREMLGVKRPGTGILPSEIDKIAGKKVKVNIEQEAQIKWEDLE